MTAEEDQAPEQLDFPRNWDVIRDPSVADELPDPDPPPTSSASTPPKIALLAASWADAVTALAVCTAALLSLVASGHEGVTTAFPWAAVLGGSWWVVSAATLILIRQGTPGMLLAGVVFRDPIAPRRVVPVVTVAALQAVFLGLPGLLGPRHSPMALVAASSLEATPTT